MTDIFDAKIMCKNCNVQMKPTIVNRNGFELRAVECKKCGEKIIHPADLNGMEKFRDIKGKNFHVKLRMVGNSHAVSIPKEIVDLINEQRRIMKKHFDEMVNLHFEDFGKLSLNFFDEEDDEDEDEGDNAEHEGLNEIDIHKMRIKRLRREYD